MITRLLVKNFQKHEKIDIELDPQITAIIGPSDIGKSSILRALRWVCLNKPQGSGFIRNGSEEAKVKVKIDNKTIARRKGKTNAYKIGTQKELVSFATGIPQPVQDITNLDEVNFQGQLDPPFWFDLSPPELARQLNELAGLSFIDKVTSYLATQLRSNRSEHKVVTSRLEEIEEGLEQTKFVEEAEKEIKEVEQKQRDLADIKEEGTELAQALAELRRKYRSFYNLRTASEEAGKVVELASTMIAVSERCTKLGYIVDRIRETELIIDSELPDLSGITKKFQRTMGVMDKVDYLRPIIERIKSLRQEQAEYQITIERIANILEVDSGGVCPACKRPL